MSNKWNFLQLPECDDVMVKPIRNTLGRRVSFFNFEDVSVSAERGEVILPLVKLQGVLLSVSKSRLLLKNLDHISNSTHYVQEDMSFIKIW